MMKRNRMLAMLLVLVMALGLLSGTVGASPAIISGVCGADATWVLDPDNHTLYIKGTGPMVIKTYYYEAPWSPLEEEILSVVIEEGITEVTGFKTCKWAERIAIPATATKVDYECFGEMPSLEYIEVEEGNPAYADIDGVLFTGDQKTLLRFPQGYKGIYAVPETVTQIEEGAFSDSTTLVELTLPEGLRNIEASTFCGCSSLKSVKLPGSLLKIRSYAFKDCVSLESIDLPQGLTTIGYDAFAGSGLRTAVIPDSVTKYDGAFGYCHKLESLTVGKGVLGGVENDYWCTPNLKTVKVSTANSVYYCDDRGVLYNKAKTELLVAPGGITGEYTVHPGVTDLGAKAFYNCYRLKKVILPAAVSCIPEQCFTGCAALEEINLEGITWYGMAALAGCVSLKEIKLAPEQPFFEYSVFSSCGMTEVEIPEGYTEIGENMFAGCLDLKNVIIPDSVETIGSNAFAETALESVTLPKALRSLGSGIFDLCENLKEINFPKGNKNFYTDVTGVVYSEDKTALLLATSLTDELIILADTVERIADGAFVLGTVRTVVIPAAVADYGSLWNLRGSSIEKYIVADTNPAFASDAQGGLYNKSLTHLLKLPQGFQGAYYAPEQLSSMESDAFAGCEGLTEIHVGKAFVDPDSQVPNMENVPAFYVSEDHPDYYNDDEGVLYSIDGTRLIYAPKDLAGNYVLPETVTKIYPYAFNGCDKLTSIDMSKCHIQEIGERVFADCIALEEIRFPQGLETLGKECFGECDSLKKVEIPEGTKTLGAYAFYSCENLREVLLPKTLIEMEYAFEDCENLRTVRFMGDAPLGASGSFLCYDTLTTESGKPDKLTMEYAYDAKGFTTPYWNGIATKVFSSTARSCDGSACGCTAFSDVPAAGHWAHNAIEEMLQQGLFKGVGKDRFAPDGTMTRAMVVTILYRQFGEPETGECTFSDVPKDTWYTDAVAWAAEQGIVNGIGNNLFAPDKAVTREQVATILSRALSVSVTENGRNLGTLACFTDEAQVSGYAERSLQTMVGMGILTGKGTKLDPKGTATRAEVATILWRWMEYSK